MTEKTRPITMTETQVVLLLQTMDQIGVTKRIHIKAISDLIVDLEAAEKSMAEEKAAPAPPLEQAGVSHQLVEPKHGP